MSFRIFCFPILLTSVLIISLDLRNEMWREVTYAASQRKLNVLAYGSITAPSRCQGNSISQRGTLFLSETGNEEKTVRQSHS